MKDEELGLAETVGLALEVADTVAAGSVSNGETSSATSASGERFELGREIGRGGMGRVLEATDRQFRRTVAIKEMLSVGDASGKKRFLTEALVTGNLQHPGIPAVYERGDRRDGSSYYAMQRVLGRTLADALDEARSLEDRLRLLPAVVKVAETVAYAHDRGVVHRDLKPQNVLVGRHGEVFLLDWGIAKVRGLATADPTMESLSDGVTTQVGTVMGSPMYMAPEQARGDTDAIDERTDVFALGAMLYHVLTGRPPYQGKTLAALSEQALAARPPAVTALVPEVQPALAAICAKAMERNAEGRHRSALELAAALEAFQSQAARVAAAPWLEGVQNAGLGAVVLLAAALFVVGAIGVYQLVVVHGGVLPLVSTFATLVAFALAAVELRTQGRAKLVGVGLSLALITLAVALGQSLLGFIHTMADLSGANAHADSLAFLKAAAEGTAEAAYGPFTSVPFALVQVVMWSLVARKNALSRHDPSAAKTAGLRSRRVPARVSRRRIAEVSFLLRALVEQLAAAGGLTGRVHHEALDVIDAFARGDEPPAASLAAARAAVARMVGRVGFGAPPLHQALTRVPIELLFRMVESGDDLSTHLVEHAAHVLAAAVPPGEIGVRAVAERLAARMNELTAQAAARAAVIDDTPRAAPPGETIAGGLAVDLPALALLHLASRGAERSGKHATAKATREILAAAGRPPPRPVLAFEAAYGGLELHEPGGTLALVVGPYAICASSPYFTAGEGLWPVIMASDDVCYSLDSKGRGFACARMVEGVFRASAANGRALLAQAVLWRALVTHPRSFVTREGLHGAALATARGASAQDDVSGPTERWWGLAEEMTLVVEIDRGNGGERPMTYATLNAAAGPRAASAGRP